MADDTIGQDQLGTEGEMERRRRTHTNAEEDHRRSQQPGEQGTDDSLNVDESEADSLRELPINTPDQSGNAEYAEPAGADNERLARESEPFFYTDGGRGDPVYGGPTPLSGRRFPDGASSVRDELERDVNADFGDDDTSGRKDGPAIPRR